MLLYKFLSSAALSIFVFNSTIGSESKLIRDSHAFVELRQQCLIGGVRNKKWAPTDQFVKTFRPIQKLSLYTLKGPAGEITASKLKTETCEGFWTVDTTPEETEGIAVVSPSWNVMPRLPRPVDLRDPTYVKVVADALRDAGIKSPVVEITQAYKVDLDGDGVDEVLIAANHYVNGVPEVTGIPNNGQAGDYSFVLLRKVVGGKVRNNFLAESIFARANEGGLARGHHISAIADLNGDGVMEVVVYAAYYEGSESYIFQIHGSRATIVLDCTCDI